MPGLGRWNSNGEKQILDNLKEETTGFGGTPDLQDKEARVKDSSKAGVTEAKTRQKM